jgi:hypothetical protein
MFDLSVVSDDIWSNISGGFLDHLDEINRDLEAAGLPVLKNHVAFGNDVDKSGPASTVDVVDTSAQN